MRPNDRCFPLIESSQCQNVVPVAFLICMQNFAGLSFTVLQEPSFSCPYPGNMMRFLKRSVKCPEKLLAVAATAIPLPSIGLLARRGKQFNLFVFHHNAVLQGLTSSAAYYFVLFLIYPLTFQKFI